MLVDGVQVLTTPVTLGDPVLVGFSGACGGFSDRHAVSNVTIGTDP